jgi:hypothetical protein
MFWVGEKPQAGDGGTMKIHKSRILTMDLTVERFEG